MQSSNLDVFISILIPRALRTSADPHFDVNALFPCLAIGMPCAAKTNAVAVDMLRLFFPSPPVPHVSIEFSGAATETILDLITSIAPII